MLATIPALLISSLFSLLLNRPWALEPITEQVMMLTPVDLSQQLLLHLGTGARPLALFGGFAVLMVVDGLTGVLAGAAGRAGWARTGLAFALQAVMLFIVFRPLDPVPTLLFWGCFVAGLLFSRWRAAAGHERAAVGRAAFLADSARILGAAAALIALLLIEPWYKSLTVYRRGGRLFAFAIPRPRQPGFTIPGLTAEVTPPGQFYYLTKNLVDPDLTAAGWLLRIDGLVRRPQTFTFEDLLAMPVRNEWVTQECVSNPVGGPLISSALFTGVPLSVLLHRVGPLADTALLVMRAVDGQADSIPLSLALAPEVLVAYGMDGTYLERAHGYPARMLIPGSYGFKSIKWIAHLELVDHRFEGTWQERGWTQEALVHTMARIDVARRISSGLLVAGIAFAGSRGVRAVQVRANQGPWLPARLNSPPLSPLTWVQWRAVLPLHRPAQGTITVEARAIDGTGALQDPRVSDIYPAGATGYHRVSLRL